MCGLITLVIFSKTPTEVSGNVEGEQIILNDLVLEADPVAGGKSSLLILSYFFIKLTEKQIKFYQDFPQKNHKKLIKKFCI